MCDPLPGALAECWKKIGIGPATAELAVPYHGAEAVQAAVRTVIEVTPVRSQRPMSTNIMIRLLMDHGMPEAMAIKLPSQIRKGASLHEEWKASFADERFVQKLGRSTTSTDASQDIPSYKRRPQRSGPRTKGSSKVRYCGAIFRQGCDFSSTWPLCPRVSATIRISKTDRANL